MRIPWDSINRSWWPILCSNRIPLTRWGPRSQSRTRRGATRVDCANDRATSPSDVRVSTWCFPALVAAPAGQSGSSQRAQQVRLIASREWRNLQPIVTNGACESALLLWQLTNDLAVERDAHAVSPTSCVILSQSSSHHSSTTSRLHSERRCSTNHIRAAPGGVWCLP